MVECLVFMGFIDAVSPADWELFAALLLGPLPLLCLWGNLVIITRICLFVKGGVAPVGHLHEVGGDRGGRYVSTLKANQQAPNHEMKLLLKTQKAKLESCI